MVFESVVDKCRAAEAASTDCRFFDTQRMELGNLVGYQVDSATSSITNNEIVSDLEMVWLYRLEGINRCGLGLRYELQLMSVAHASFLRSLERRIFG